LGNARDLDCVPPIPTTEVLEGGRPALLRGVERRILAIVFMLFGIGFLSVLTATVASQFGKTDSQMLAESASSGTCGPLSGTRLQSSHDDSSSASSRSNR